MSLMKLLYIHQIITQHLKIITETGKYAPLHRSNHSIINVIIENCKDAPLHITIRLHRTHCSDITYEITTYIDQVIAQSTVITETCKDAPLRSDYINLRNTCCSGVRCYRQSTRRGTCDRHPSSYAGFDLCIPCLHN